MTKITAHAILFIACLNSFFVFGQAVAPIAVLNVGYNESSSGLAIFDVGNNNVVIIGEDVHNRIDMPRATLKFLQHLHKLNGTRVLAIEGGTSTAFLVNRYLDTQDTVLLREIVRHTFYWGIEHQQFLKELAQWNEQLSDDQKIKLRSADIEIKQESVVLAINVLLKEQETTALPSGLRSFREIFEEKSSHRNKFDALNVFYYYDKDKCRKAAEAVLADVAVHPDQYKTIFGPNVGMVKTMMQDLISQYTFNYKDTHYGYRDAIIYQKLLSLHNDGITKFLYIVGGKHTGQGSSSYRLQHDALSPFHGKVVFINITARKPNGKFQGSKAVSDLSARYPEMFCADCHVLIRNDGSTKLLTQVPDYTLAFKNTSFVRKFSNTFTGD
ncbi:hypothetical protein [Chryseolinea lacunae]|uniref:Haem-binding uptake Tiki superfamily ChaN domain-containing protein n=1 Tax=Chryseolinea lacunae TaxID=2801331 RepID=A0ABS1KLR9_9BACT|nr:hypothetical protein [Chryseolinea lacunae]MBL0740395.1 hypothetical protein [Chryseolinea lacunae]